MPDAQLDLSFEAVYPQVRERVWAALTDTRALATWLLDNDFEARVGHRFVLRGPDIGEIRCAVAVLEPPQRMEWLWNTAGVTGATRVTFRLEEVEGGTKLIVRHQGPVAPEHRAAFTRGWPVKLASLTKWLWDVPAAAGPTA